MSAALRPYARLAEAKDDKTRARLIAEAFDGSNREDLPLPPQMLDFKT